MQCPLVDLIATAKMLVNIMKVRGEEAKRVHCNGGIKILDRVGDLHGYRTVWYKQTGIAKTYMR